MGLKRAHTVPRGYGAIGPGDGERAPENAGKRLVRNGNGISGSLGERDVVAGRQSLSNPDLLLLDDLSTRTTEARLSGIAASTLTIIPKCLELQES